MPLRARLSQLHNRSERSKAKSNPKNFQGRKRT